MNARPNARRRSVAAVAALSGALAALVSFNAPAVAQTTGPAGPGADALPPPSIIDMPAGATTRRVLTPGAPGGPGAGRDAAPAPLAPEPPAFEQFRRRFGPASTAAPGAGSGVGLPAGPGDGSLPGSDPGIRR